jgi:hypothetical protein
MTPGIVMVSLVGLVACVGRRGDAPISDRAFVQVQERGAQVMGVDPYRAQHVFESLPDGGRIVLEWPDSTAAPSGEVATIRGHMREIASVFRQGDFSAPFLVHATEVPGTEVMRSRREVITYEAIDRPAGAELRIRTSDPDAVAAVGTFLAFQRNEHRAPGHAH